MHSINPLQHNSTGPTTHDFLDTLIANLAPEVLRNVLATFHNYLGTVVPATVHLDGPTIHEYQAVQDFSFGNLGGGDYYAGSLGLLTLPGGAVVPAIMGGCGSPMSSAWQELCVAQQHADGLYTLHERAEAAWESEMESWVFGSDHAQRRAESGHSE